MDTPLLEIKDLSVSFQNGKEKVEAVKNISFSLEKGKTLAIVGESGSGKSVTALSIMRLLPQDARVSAEGVWLMEGGKRIPVLEQDQKKMQGIRGNRISMIFQEPMTSLNPVTRCGRQVTEAIREHQEVTAREAHERALQLFSEVKLPRPEEIFRSYPFELSGGQKQRVMIAMAVSSGPGILIADEPTTALDVTVQKAILELIRNLQQKYGMAVLFITHDLGLVSAIADDMVVMKDGCIVEAGPATQVLASPVHPYTRGLLACRPGLDSRLKRLPTVKDFIEKENKEPGTVNLPEKNLPEQEEESIAREKIYSSPPVLIARVINTRFPVRQGKLISKKTYLQAVDHVSIDIYRGETLGLVGESGCGKTTLGRSILRLIEPDGGTVHFHGQDIMELRGKALRRMRKRLQIIFQDPYSSLNPRMTAGEAILEPMTVHGIFESRAQRKEKVMELMESTGLERSHYHRYPHEFSGGQRQRICIARALAVEPELIVCDESVSALDVSVQAQVLNLLNDLKETFGLTYLFISHDLSVVKFMSDRIIVMKDGKIEEEGNPDEIYRNPGSSYTKKLIDSIVI